jgi:hypothetical protein
MAKEGYTDISFILDRSGSMDIIANDTIGGYNTFIKGQRETEGKATFNLIQFDNEYKVVYENLDIRMVPELTHKTFVPRSTTALYDAIGKTIVSNLHRFEKINEEDKPEKVIVVILTDGHENASHEFDQKQIFDMIKHQENKNDWEFVFLGANQDAMEVGHTLGVKRGSSMTYAASSRGVNKLFRSVTKKMSAYRTMKGSKLSGDYFDQKDRDDQKEELSK